MTGGASNQTDVFDTVSNSTRVDILHALARAYGETPTDPYLEYTDLRKAVGVRDNGNFNYHLDQLGDLVVKRDDGYTLSRVGMEVVSAVSSGVFDADWTWGPVDAPGDCLFCDDAVQLHYEDGVLWLSCGMDEHTVGLSVPPSLLESHPEDVVVERIAFLENRWGALTRQGICSECRGYVEGEIEFGGVQPDHYHYHGRCRRCGFRHGIPVGLYLLSHPAVTTFYYDHGVDVRSTPFWTVDGCTPGAETVLSTDPLRLRVEFTQDGDTLSLTLDRDGSVVSTDRSSAPAE
ncbi:DUF7351 domain-containing protein [Haloarchaeobius sp. HRN-SO-5]|uniref:DUF7351 domain-containing protein n=1 Tax=Haloarchaeobius sp. HRN-SO-5 TaxID=3446118 RepID=UPI003EBCA58A